MSEPTTAPAPGGSFMQKRIGGIPMPIIIVGAVAIIAYLYFRSQSSSSSGQGTTSSTGNTASTQTGNVSQPATSGPQSLTVNIAGGSTQSSGGNSGSTGDNTGDEGSDLPPLNWYQPPSGTPNPQPSPPPQPPKRPVHQTKVKTPAKTPAQYVTVAKWPGKSVKGLAQWNTTMWGIANHYHMPLSALEKLNPQVKNPNLIYPGQHIRVKLWP